MEYAGIDGLSVGGVARELGVPRSTVIKWANRGVLRSIRTPGGHRRFEPGEVERLNRECREGLGIEPVHVASAFKSSRLIDGLDFTRNFWERVRVNTETQCWEWTASVSDGYGQLSARALGIKSPTQAHRVAWLLFRGDVPEGYHIHHTCQGRLCCNPDHLEVVTPREHRQRHCDQEKCVEGHPWTAETTRFQGNGGRVCRLCDRDRNRRNRALARELEAA